jgi:hypothetical protein
MKSLVTILASAFLFGTAVAADAPKKDAPKAEAKAPAKDAKDAKAPAKDAKDAKAPAKKEEAKK